MNHIDQDGVTRYESKPAPWPKWAQVAFWAALIVGPFACVWLWGNGY